MAFFDGFTKPSYDYGLPNRVALAPGFAPTLPAAGAPPSTGVNVPGAVRTISGTVNVVPVQILASDEFVDVDTQVARTLYLPAGAPAGTMLIFKDIYGAALSNPITITPAPGSIETIEGAASKAITVNNGRLILVKDQGNPGLTPAGAAQWRVLVQDVPVTDNPFVLRRLNGGQSALQLVATDTYVAIDSSKGAQTLYLPTAPPAGTLIVVQDVGNAARTYNITVTFAAIGASNFFAGGMRVVTAGTTAAVGSDTIAANNGRRSFYFDGTSWNLIASSCTERATTSTVTATATLATDDEYVPIDETATMTVTLPPNPRKGQIIILKGVVGTGSGSLTLRASGSALIQYTTTAATATPSAITTSAYQRIQFLFDGTNWYQIGA